MKKLRLKNMNEAEKLRLVWTTETSDEFDYCKTLYYAARAIEVYGSACRDNSFAELVQIGKELDHA